MQEWGQGWGFWTGLGASPFLADVRAKPDDAARFVATLTVGFAIAFIAVVAGWLLVMCLATVAEGRGPEGFRGLGEAAVPLRDLHVGGLFLTVLRLLLAASTDSLFLLVFVAVAAALARHDLKRYCTAAPVVRWRLLLAGVALAMLALAPIVVAERVLAPESAAPITAISGSPWGRLAYAASTLLLVPAAAAEELFFRGWLTRQIAALTRRPSVLIVASAFIFSALHRDFSLDGFITRAVMGAGLAYMTLRLGGVELAAGVHAANNIMIVLFLQPLVLSDVAPSSGFNPASLIEEVLLLGGYCAITEAVARLSTLRRWLGVSEAEISAGAALPASLG